MKGGKWHSYLRGSLLELKESDNEALKTVPGSTGCSTNVNVRHSLGRIPTLDWRNIKELRSVDFQLGLQPALQWAHSDFTAQFKKLLSKLCSLW